MTGCKIGKIKMKNGGAEIRVFENGNYLQNDTTAVLEDVLRAARKGDVVAVMVGFICSDGSANCGFSDKCFEDKTKAVGVASRLVHFMNGRLFEKKGES